MTGNGSKGGAMRTFTAAAVQVQPMHDRLSSETIKANVDHAVDYVERCVEATEAELVVLPETVTTGFTPGCSAEELWDVLGEPDGPTVGAFAETSGRLGIHLVWGTYARGDERGVVYNSAVLAGPSGTVLGTYRKTHPFCTELRSRGGWVTPGDDVCVVSTEPGRIGLMVCFDGDFPELVRIMALQGAEVIVRPSALLRSADIWELTNRARAYDNHVFVVGANAVGIDPGGVLYFGNSMIVTPTAEILAWGSTHESWVSARLDPSLALASLTPGSSVRQGFDHLAERNLELLGKHADTLLGPGATPFPYQPARGG
jgi:deaminated glutathione amidase